MEIKRIIRLCILLIILCSANQFCLAQKRYMPFDNSSFMELNDIQYHYRVWRPKGEIKERIFFLHGFSGSTFSWRKNIDTLIMQRYLVVAADIPPFGFSGISEETDYSVSVQAENLWELLDSVCKGKWFLAGHSMGASYAGAMAFLHPEKTAGVIFVDGTYMGLHKTTFSQKLSGALFSSSFVRSLADLVGTGFFYNYSKFEKLLSSAYACMPDSDAVRGYLFPFVRKSGIGGAIFSMASGIEKKELGALNNLPVLILWGKKDAWIPLSVGIKLNKTYPGSEFFVIEGAGHCPMETHPWIVNKKISDFMGSIRTK